MRLLHRISGVQFAEEPLSVANCCDDLMSSLFQVSTSACSGSTRLPLACRKLFCFHSASPHNPATSGRCPRWDSLSILSMSSSTAASTSMVGFNRSLGTRSVLHCYPHSERDQISPISVSRSRLKTHLFWLAFISLFLSLIKS